ncbi:MAG TPA: MgtC/SapB family protein [Burkholderiales bacterium]|nr:MgtC/SapB family protein [Burkholderiales bacterium]
MDLLGPAPSLDLSLVIGLVAALVFGALVGFERQLRGHVAGLHANALVSLGSAAYVVASLLVGDDTGPARVAGQVVTGVGFLCAGVIIKRGLTVVGINTAATVWCSSAIGVLAGLGLVLWAGVVTTLVLAGNFVLHYLEHYGLRPDNRPSGPG